MLILDDSHRKGAEYEEKLKAEKSQKIFLGEFEDNWCILFTEKVQYRFGEGNELYTYKNFISLNVSYDELITNNKPIDVEKINKLKTIYPMLKTNNLCSGKTVREIEL